MEQVVFTVKTFKCTSLQQAVFLMTKDSITGGYNHTFMGDKDGQYCKVCLDTKQNLHLSVKPSNIELNLKVIDFLELFFLSLVYL